MLDDAGKSAEQNDFERSGESRQAGVVQRDRIPGQLCGGSAGRRGCTFAAQELTVRLIFITLLALILATVVGLGATWLTATRGTDLGTLTIGAWTARPKTGTADVDPYSRASIARSGELPVGTGDGVAFSATTDDRKRPLDGRCDVVVSGVTPAARFWTLTLYDSKGHLVANSLQRYGFTSQEIIRGADGAFEIRVASRSRAGNWLPTGGIERYALMLRLYDTPVGVATRTQRDAPMPADRDGGVPMIRWLFTIIAGVLLGGVVHLVSVLALPRIATQDAYSRLTPITRINAVTALPPADPNNTLMPFMDPAFALAICRYDLVGGPIKLAVPVSQAYTSVSFYTRNDVAYYAINDRSAGRKVIELDLMTEAQHAELPEDEDVTAADRLIINSPTATGLIVLKALAPEPGLMPQAQASLAASSCKVQTEPAGEAGRAGPGQALIETRSVAV